MRKRTVRTGCIGITLAVLLTGCGGGAGSGADTAAEQPQATVQVSETAERSEAAEDLEAAGHAQSQSGGRSDADAQESSDRDSDTAAQAASAADAASEETAAADSAKADSQAGDADSRTASGDFSEVIVDDDSLKFELKGVDENGLWGYTWKTSIENKTDRTIMVTLDRVSINGVMCDPFWAVDIAAGKTANEEISWDSQRLRENGIDTVTQVEFELFAYDTETYDEYLKSTFTVYPEGEEAASVVTWEADASDRILFDNEACTMAVTDIDPNGEWGFTVSVHLENKTDELLFFSTDEVSVNGIMCDPFWGTEVAAGKSENTEIVWMQYDLDENDITEVDEIEFRIMVHNDEWTNTYEDEVITFTP